MNPIEHRAGPSRRKTGKRPLQPDPSIPYSQEWVEGRVPDHLIPQFYVLLRALQVGFKLHNLGSEVLVEAARQVRIVDEWD